MINSSLKIKKPIYPIIGILSTIIIFVAGLVSAKSIGCTIFLLAVWLVFVIYGYWRACLAIIPIAIILGGSLSLITFGITGDYLATYAAFNRIFAVCIALIPGIAVPHIMLTRNLTQIKVPRTITLGMMITMSFFPLLKREVKQIREAMRTRGAGSIMNPKVFYRAFLIPLIMRLVNISDTLALSIETRGFSTGKQSISVYKPVTMNMKDILFLGILIAGVACLAVVV